LALLATNDLITGRRPDESPWGIAYLVAAAAVMFGLSVVKRRTADQLDSAPLRSEATMTLLDGFLATATLIGLTLNAVVGWWWADPSAALIVAVAAANEARENWGAASEID
jgi:divalent metal cation (Fe/Co/Zn/Cd) transporter